MYSPKVTELQGRSQINVECKLFRLGAKSPTESHELYNRNGDVFDNFESAFNNMNFK